MEKQLDTHTKYQDDHWLNIAETAAVVSSVGGTIASIFIKEIFLASIPLSACVALNLVNRKRILNLVVTKNSEAIAALAQANQSDRANVCDQMMQIQQSVTNNHEQYQIDNKNISDNLKQIDSSSQKQIQKLETQYQELLSKSVKLARSATSSSAELYYQNAVGYQQMGEEQKAIDEYTKAIQIDLEYAEAYANRGILFADMGNKQPAIEDLRKAAKLYFQKGYWDEYQSIKQKTQDLHQLNSSPVSKDKDSKQVLANSLFD